MIQSSIRTIRIGAGLVILLAVLLGFALQKAGAAASAAKTYYLLVFSNPVAGQEDVYNRWYEGQHIKDVVAVPGFVDARRFVLADKQLIDRADIPALPRYLAAYRIVTADLPAVMAEVGARVRSGQTKLSPAYDRATSLNYSYAVMGADAGARLMAAPEKGARQSFWHIVFTVPAVGRETEFNRWYDASHMADMLRIPGMAVAQRLVLADAGRGTVTPTRYAAIFSGNSESDATLAQGFKSVAATMQRSPALDRTLTRGYTYRAIGSPVIGDAVRAARGREPGAVRQPHL